MTATIIQIQGVARRLWNSVISQFEYITFIQKPGRDEIFIWLLLGIRAWHISHAQMNTNAGKVYTLLFKVVDYPYAWTAATIALWLIHAVIICAGTPRQRANILLVIFFWFGFFAWMGYYPAPTAAYWMDNVVAMIACVFIYCCALAQNPSSIKPWAVQLAARLIHRVPCPHRTLAMTADEGLPHAR